MDANESAWIGAVEARLGSGSIGIDDDTKRVLLRLTKVTADATGVRYLAPLTAFLVGRAAGMAGEGFDLRAAADAIGELAASWPSTTDPSPG